MTDDPPWFAYLGRKIAVRRLGQGGSASRFMVVDLLPNNKPTNHIRFIALSKQVQNPHTLIVKSCTTRQPATTPFPPTSGKQLLSRYVTSTTSYAVERWSTRWIVLHSVQTWLKEEAGRTPKRLTNLGKNLCQG
jgi:hypothetical protein